MVHLPQELIIQILLRLPVKSLVRFKCVSKSWLSLISDPHFALSHFELASAPTQRLMRLAPSAAEVRSIDYNASIHASVALNPSFPIQRAMILGSCRGLLLFYCNPDLYLWNPSTGVHKRIPSSPIESNLVKKVVMINNFLYGFGYDPSTDDYLVVHAYCYPSPNDLVTHVELFSFRANMWKQMEGTHLSYADAYDYIPCAPSFGSLLNGAVHWLAFPADENRIVAFDLTERSFSDIPLPDDFERGIICCHLRVIGGFLSLWVLEANAKVMWMMKEYKVQSSWTKTVVVSLDDIPTQYFSPICSSKSGHIVGTDGHTGLVKCDNRGQLLEYFTFGDYVNECYVAMYTESLLPLPGVQAEEDD